MGHLRITSYRGISDKVFRRYIYSIIFSFHPLDPPAPEPGVMKPDIVFFGEGLPDSFHSAMAQDKNQCDLLIVIGSSLKVRPVALIPSK